MDNLTKGGLIGGGLLATFGVFENLALPTWGGSIILLIALGKGLMAMRTEWLKGQKIKKETENLTNNK